MKQYPLTPSKIAIIGLGYVGLPLACLCSEKGHQVIGIDIDKKKVNQINQKISHFKDKRIQQQLKKASIKASDDYQNIKKVETIIICVPTPVDESHQPMFQAITSSGQQIAQHLQKKQLVILESTVNPSATEEILKPILEKSDLKAGQTVV